MTDIRNVLLTMLAATLVLLAGCSGGGNKPPEQAKSSEVLEIGELEGRPTAKLADGRVFILDDLKEWEALRERFPADEGALSSSPVGISAEPTLTTQALPARVDLSRFQTPIKNQGGRGTCVAHAVVAGMEAAYKRSHGVTLDLSEQYVHHINKMSLLPPSSPALPAHENSLGPFYGGGVGYEMRLFSQGHAAPLESEVPYIGTGDYELWTQPGDNPSFDWRDASIPQRAYDDFNLIGEPTTINIPASQVVNHLPYEAIVSGHKMTSIRFATGGELRDLNWFKTELAANREVIFATRLCADPVPSNSVWDPDPDADPTACNGHAMLMVGYDDATRTFLVKNSWGGSDYVRLSYDYVTEGMLNEAGVVLGVLAPGAVDSSYSAQKFLGRWHLEHDGWRGLLDIYHLPGTFPASGLEGREDRRLGTYYGPDGVARRVNGSITNNNIEFYIDWDTPNLRYDQLQGLKFTGTGFHPSRPEMAGTMLDNRDGKTYGFYARREEFLSGATRSPTITPTSFVGGWVLRYWNQEKNLEITGVNGSTGALSGVTGRVDLANPRHVVFTNEGISFDGYLHSRQAGIMSGTYTSSGVTHSFYAYRLADEPTLTIDYPSEGDTLTTYNRGVVLRSSKNSVLDGAHSHLDFRLGRRDGDGRHAPLHLQDSRSAPNYGHGAQG